jgi:hypothetical protein
MPRGLDALGQIPGMGRTKLERYGRRVLDIVTAFERNPAPGG